MRTVVLATGATVWALALYGSTRVHQLDLPLGHGICGPWGCAAAPESLIGYHFFWLALLAPLMVLVCRALPRLAGRQLTKLAAGVAVAAIGAIVVGSALAWIRDGNAAEYALQRGLFVLATTPDLPVVQLLLAAAAGRLAVPRRPVADQAVEGDAVSRENRAF